MILLMYIPLLLLLLQPSNLISGKPTGKGTYPFMISFIYAGKHNFSGLLLNETHVLSSSDCSNAKYMGQYLVRAGAYDTADLTPIKKSGEWQDNSIPEEPRTCERTSVGLFKVADEFEKTKNVKFLYTKMSVPQDKLDETLDNGKVTIIGWGGKIGKEKTKSLHKFTGTLQDHEDCAQGMEGYDQHTMYCVKLSGNNICLDACGYIMALQWIKGKDAKNHKKEEWVVLGVSIKVQKCSLKQDEEDTEEVTKDPEEGEAPDPGDDSNKEKGKTKIPEDAKRFVYFANVDKARCWIQNGDCEGDCETDERIGFVLNGDSNSKSPYLTLISLYILIRVIS